MTVSFVAFDDLAGIASPYDAIFCDVWGVLHNGVKARQPAWRALQAARNRGQAVILITNAPRPHANVRQMLERLAIPEDSYDAIVTSGDVTRALIAKARMPVFHIGPERDMPLYDGLDVSLADEADAATIVCTGLFDDETETPEDYAAMLSRLAKRDLPMICANPDIVVERGSRLIWCAGALARDYEDLGARTEISGKPHAPIYEKARQEAARVLGRRPGKVLAIGDALATDMRGAVDSGFDFLYISQGIHAGEYGRPEGHGRGSIAEWLASKGAAPQFVMPHLA